MTEWFTEYKMAFTDATIIEKAIKIQVMTYKVYIKLHWLAIDSLKENKGLFWSLFGLEIF